jgi:hypothetical protein
VHRVFFFFSFSFFLVSFFFFGNGLPFPGGAV